MRKKETKKKLRKPNFFIIGEHKSGTTSIHYYLSQHPEIFMSKVKETGYFIRKSRGEENDDEQFLKKHFSQVKNEKIIGEGTISCLYFHKTHEMIKKFNPKAKLLLVIRNPLTHVPSSHEEALRAGQEDVPSLKKALELEPERLKGKKLPKTYKDKSPKEAIRTVYMHNAVRKIEDIKNLLKYFPASHIKVVFMEDLNKKPYETYKDILKFLGVKNLNFKPDLTRKQTYKKVRWPWLWTLIINPYTRKFFRQILPEKTFSRLREFMFNIGLKKAPRPKLDPDIEKMLFEKFKPKVKELDELLHKHNMIPKKKNLLKFWRYEK